MRPVLIPHHEPKTRSRFSWLFRLASRLFKYYFLSLVGFVVVCLLASVFGVYATIEPSMPTLIEWFARLAVFTLCFLIVAIVVESLRQ